MGIIKISDNMHDAAKVMGRAMGRSINAQAEYWMQIGKLIEENPTINYAEVIKILIDKAALAQHSYEATDND